MEALKEENATLKQEKATLIEQKAALEKENGELKIRNGVLEHILQQMGGDMTALALGNANVHADNQRKSEKIQLLQNQVNIEDLKKRFDEDQQKLHVENNSLKDQLKAVQEENELLQKQNRDLELKVQKLTKSVEDLEAKNQTQETRMKALECEKARQETRMKALECEKARREELALATDLFSMHVLYAMDGMKKWSQLREQAGNLKADWEDGVITQAEYDADLAELAKQAQLSPGDFLAWIALKDERNSGTHADLRSAKNQKTFLTKIETHTFTTLHSEQTALQNVINFLKTQVLKRNK